MKKNALLILRLNTKQIFSYTVVLCFHFKTKLSSKKYPQIYHLIYIFLIHQVFLLTVELYEKLDRIARNYAKTVRSKKFPLQEIRLNDRILGSAFYLIG